MREGITGTYVKFKFLFINFHDCNFWNQLLMIGPVLSLWGNNASNGASFSCAHNYALLGFVYCKITFSYLFFESMQC
jgi:hypothetical protein